MSLIFTTSQLLQLVSILIIAWVFEDKANSLITINMFATINFPVVEALKGLVVVLLVMRPVNTVFRQLFPNLKPDETDVPNKKMTDLQAGRLIGNMERLLVVILLYAGQYSVIGLIFAAKSITRYKRISEQQEFAEYYLVGTLFSMLSALVIYGVVYKLF